MVDKATINFYDKSVEAYAGWRDKEKNNEHQEFFLSCITKGNKILDLGCGTGGKAIWFAERGLEVTAVDASLKMVEHVKKFDKVTALHLSIDEIECLENFAGVWASFSIQHLPIKVQNRAFLKVANILNRGGTFYLGIHEGKTGYRDSLGRYYLPRTEDDLKLVLGKNNLEIFKFERGLSKSYDGHDIEIMHIFAKKVGW